MIIQVTEDGCLKSPIEVVVVEVIRLLLPSSAILGVFGDKIAILTMKMIFYKLLAIAAGIQLL